jgi:hypothetical protein
LRLLSRDSSMPLINRSSTRDTRGDAEPTDDQAEEMGVGRRMPLT